MSDELTPPVDETVDEMPAESFGGDFGDYDGGDFEGSTVHHLDAIELKSLGCVSGLFYFTAFLVLALAIVAVWVFAASLGLISQVEDFMRSVGFRGFRIVGPEVVLGFVLILLALVLFLTVMTLIAGAFYNILGTGRRGIKVRTSVVERRPRTVDAPVDEPSADEPAEATPKLVEAVTDEVPTAGGNGKSAAAKADAASDTGDVDDAADEAEPEKPEAVAG
jgi:hypothetical protein